VTTPAAAHFEAFLHIRPHEAEAVEEFHAAIKLGWDIPEARQNAARARGNR